MVTHLLLGIGPMLKKEKYTKNLEELGDEMEQYCYITNISLVLRDNKWKRKE